MFIAQAPRKVVVIGASSTVGVEVCKRYLTAGHLVTAHFNSSLSKLSTLEPHSRLVPVRCDLTDLDSVRAFAETNTDADILIFLASFATPSQLENIDLSQLERALAVGALSNYILMGSIGPAMAQRQWGRIVIGSSIGVKFGGGTDSFAYALANHASEFLPRSVRDWTASNVLTNVVRIGVTDTPLHEAFPDRDFQQRVALVPLKRAATTAEIADFITWYGSEQNTFVSGQTIAISGGE
ncbi:SDR family oxidoreductase [bacterium]|nr:SDR family oxidoreductase [bacterium]